MFCIHKALRPAVHNHLLLPPRFLSERPTGKRGETVQFLCPPTTPKTHLGPGPRSHQATMTTSLPIAPHPISSLDLSPLSPGLQATHTPHPARVWSTSHRHFKLSSSKPSLSTSIPAPSVLPPLVAVASPTGSSSPSSNYHQDLFITI